MSRIGETNSLCLPNPAPKCELTTHRDVINSLPYLEAFTHELCRLYPAAPTMFRVPQCDCILPLSQPKRCSNGRLMESLVLQKGDTIHVAYGNINLSRNVFGEDATEVKPERFIGHGEEKATLDQTYTFGGEARNCVCVCPSSLRLLFVSMLSDEQRWTIRGG
jgi:cytochrome P450